VFALHAWLTSRLVDEDERSTVATVSNQPKLRGGRGWSVRRAPGDSFAGRFVLVFGSAINSPRSHVIADIERRSAAPAAATRRTP